MEPAYSDLNVIKEEEEENFMMTSLFSAAEEGNISAVEELLSSCPNVDLNSVDKLGHAAVHLAAGGGHLEFIQFLHSKGAKVTAIDMRKESAIFWAARYSHVNVMQYFKDLGVSVNVQNEDSETPLHVATKFGQIKSVDYLCANGANITLKDKQGETPLHVAAWHGLPASVCFSLCSTGASLDTRNKEEETALHCAASRGNLDCLRVLIAHGAAVNAVDKKGYTALHLATRRRHVQVAMALLQYASVFDVTDQGGETPLHSACREGLLPVVQTMCAYGCAINIPNKGGMAPLHLAAKAGHTEIVRCLLLSGVSVDQPNKDGISAEIMAIAQGHNEAAELLGRLKPEKQDTCIKQLMPSTNQLRRIKVKVFGNSSVGKTTVIDTLRSGYLSSLLRKAGIGSSNNTTSATPATKSGKENGLKHQGSILGSQLSFEADHTDYTRGIEVQQAAISGAGEVSFWEFSGYQPYYMLYDKFIGDYNCVHIVVYSLTSPYEQQVAQVSYWLNFLKARIQSIEPIHFGGRQPFPARVILVATHADKISSNSNNNNGEYSIPETFKLLETIMKIFWTDFHIHTQVFTVDAHIVMAPEMKALRQLIGGWKSEICAGLPCGNGFLEATVAALPGWCKILSSYPVVTWPSFIEYVRSTVNLLASEEHLKEVMCQLQLMGEVVYIETDVDDLVVLSPRWLCGTVVGMMLSEEATSLVRPTGCFTVEDFQSQFSEFEAGDLLTLLEALEVATRCEIDGEVEYELPCFNFVETLSGLWDLEELSDAVYVGVRVAAPPEMEDQLMHVFPRLQARLRRDYLQKYKDRQDTDLYQWFHGSKYCRGSSEQLITLSNSDKSIDIKCRGPKAEADSIYYDLEDLYRVIQGVLDESLPGMTVQRLPLSVVMLTEHRETVEAYSCKEIMYNLLKGQESMTLTLEDGEEISEDIFDLIALGSTEIIPHLEFGLDLHISSLSVVSRRALSAILDPPDPMGRDWCLLAVSLGLSEELPMVDTAQQMTVSKTDHCLALWAQNAQATVRELLTKLLELGREDAVTVILNTVPIFVYEPKFSAAADNTSPENQNEMIMVNGNGSDSVH